MKTSYGIFKGVFEGFGIYWDGTYNVEGYGQYPTKAEAQAYIKWMHAQRAEKEQAESVKKIAQGAIGVTKQGDLAIVHWPHGDESMPMRNFRQNVFQWEAEGKEFVWQE